jgi:molybdate transport system substrate-binding protein
MAAALVALIVVVAAAACGGDPARNASGDQPAEIVVAAASDLRPVFDELARAHEQDTGVRVALVYGSSGMLARQALAGAPFDVFASADVARAEAVAAARPGDGAPPVPFAVGQLVLVGRGDAAALKDLADASSGLVAIANPEHAPYGRAAEEALRAAGVWEALRDRLVLADNVADAARLYAAGEVDAALVARSLVDPGAGGGVTVVPDNLHDPIRQSLVVLVAADAPTRPAAEAFADRVLGDQGRRLLAARGFVLPTMGDGIPTTGGGW